MGRLCRPENTAFRALDGEAVVITLRDRQIHVMNETAALIYGVAAEGGTVDEAAAALSAAYEIAEEQARADVLELWDDLVARGILAQDLEDANGGLEAEP